MVRTDLPDQSLMCVMKLLLDWQVLSTHATGTDIALGVEESSQELLVIFRTIDTLIAHFKDTDR